MREKKERAKEATKNKNKKRKRKRNKNIEGGNTTIPFEDPHS